MKMDITSSGVDMKLDRTDLQNIQIDISQLRYLRLDDNNALCILACRVPMSQVNALMVDSDTLMQKVKE